MTLALLLLVATAAALPIQETALYIEGPSADACAAGAAQCNAAQGDAVSLIQQTVSFSRRDSIHVEGVGGAPGSASSKVPWNHSNTAALAQQEQRSSCVDFPGFVDVDGDGCAKITSKQWCGHAADFAVGGVSAKEACCGCGGGIPQTCVDLPGFFDSDGDDCAKITGQKQCNYADDFAVNGISANHVCCGCGGGMRNGMSCVTLDPKTRWGPVTQGDHCRTWTDTRGKQKVNKNRVMFVGDSDIEFWHKFEETFPGAVNCGVGGGTAWEAAATAATVAKRYRPKDFVVFISGENDFAYQGPESCVDTVFNDWKKAVEAFLASPHTPTVIAMGTKPEPGTLELHPLYEKFDLLVQKYASDSGGKVKFVHTYSRFKEMGNPTKLYDEDDIHLSPLGYTYFTGWVQEAMKPEVQEGDYYYV